VLLVIVPLVETVVLEVTALLVVIGVTVVWVV
jgi:hypothetical protein